MILIPIIQNTTLFLFLWEIRLQVTRFSFYEKSISFRNRTRPLLLKKYFVTVTSFFMFKRYEENYKFSTKIYTKLT
jgi:hypothetical protein